jgi:ATP-binding cassette subfamily B protein
VIDDLASGAPRFAAAPPPSGYPAPSVSIHPDPARGWFRRLWPVLGGERARFALALGGALVAMVAGTLLPRVSMDAIDRALVARDIPLARYLWVLVGLAVGRAVVTFAYRRTLFGIAYRLEERLRLLMHEHLTRLSFAFYDRVQSGQLISRANSDIRSVQMFTTFAPLLALQVASLAVALALMLSIHVGLTLASLATLPVTYAVGHHLRNELFPLSWIVQGRAAEIATIVDENVQGARVVKGFAAEDRELRSLAVAAQRLRWANLAQNSARARWGPLLENLPRIGLVVVLVYGGHLAIDGDVTVGALVAFNAYVVLLQAPFRFLATILILGQRAKASAGRIYEVLDEAPAVQDRPGAVDLVEAHGRVELRAVRFGYGDHDDVLRGFDLVIEPGETVAIVGRTGCGKSTVARAIARFYDVRDGAVLLDGRDVRDLTLASVRHHVGLVLDEPFLFSASVRDNVAFARPDASDGEVAAAIADAQASEFVAELPEGDRTVLGERGYDLSGGQRQRLSIARTLLADPTVLVLDDATSAIDARVEEAIHEALRRRRAGRTTVLVAHRLSTILLADRVVLIDAGRVVADGTHAELLAREPRYAEVLARAGETAPS